MTPTVLRGYISTALELGLAKCSECGEILQVDIPSGIVEKLRRRLSSKPYYRMNVDTVSN